LARAVPAAASAHTRRRRDTESVKHHLKRKNRHACESIGVLGKGKSPPIYLVNHQTRTACNKASFAKFAIIIARRHNQGTLFEVHLPRMACTEPSCGTLSASTLLVHRHCTARRPFGKSLAFNAAAHPARMLVGDATERMCGVETTGSPFRIRFAVTLSCCQPSGSRFPLKTDMAGPVSLSLVGAHPPQLCRRIPES
jgi:hypothetical protein